MADREAKISDIAKRISKLECGETNTRHDQTAGEAELKVRQGAIEERLATLQKDFEDLRDEEAEEKIRLVVAQERLSQTLDKVSTHKRPASGSMLSAWHSW